MSRAMSRACQELVKGLSRAMYRTCQGLCQGLVKGLSRACQGLVNVYVKGLSRAPGGQLLLRQKRPTPSSRVRRSAPPCTQGAHRALCPRCGRAPRKVEYFGPVSPVGQGDHSTTCVPIHGTQSKNSGMAMFHTESTGLLSKSAVFALRTYALKVVGGLKPTTTQPQQTPVTGRFADLETCAEVPGAPDTTQQPQREAGSDIPPPPPRGAHQQH